MNPTPFHELLRRDFLELSPHMRECGLRATAVDAHGALVTLPYREDWLGDSESGRLNPGIITVLVDSCAGLAVLASIGAREPVATLDLRMDYLRPAFRGGDVQCRASCLRLTASIAFVRATVWQEREDEPFATAQLVFMRTAAARPPTGAAA
ncbi:PaaI family thioesterase [Solimonas soli]|uniref:PaaI family thioesterase n=1 Tax=Solimonas soli TaxID=413479 RepID=UPI0004863090|nr:PaaI family thioesterase [Solimonas soli]